MTLHPRDQTKILTWASEFGWTVLDVDPMILTKLGRTFTIETNMGGMPNKMKWYGGPERTQHGSGSTSMGRIRDWMATEIPVPAPDFLDGEVLSVEEEPTPEPDAAEAALDPETSTDEPTAGAQPTPAPTETPKTEPAPEVQDPAEDVPDATVGQPQSAVPDPPQQPGDDSAENPQAERAVPAAGAPRKPKSAKAAPATEPAPATA